jgi:4-amino-4-deoxy-L-arabinose transferase-like glycosyltransferase
MSNPFKNLAYLILGLTLIFSFVIMFSISSEESAIMDELAHIPAGYGYVEYLDYRLNPEHPPLVKMLSALPLSFMNLNFPTDRSAWQSEVNGQWAAGAQFLYESGNDADEILKWARVGPIILTLILILFIYFWSKELIGPWWALLPSLLFAFSPTVLSHGHYVTTDIGAALGIFISIYYFIKARLNPSPKNLVFAGVAFGIAQLLKFSTFILIPYFIILVGIFYLTDIYRNWNTPGSKSKKIYGEFLKQAKNLLVIFVVSFLIIYPLYFLTTANYPPDRQRADTDFILASFANGRTPEGEVCKPARCLADFNVWASDKPLLRPYAEYMLGILMVIQRSSGGNTNYFLGEVSASGWWYYFPVTYAMKESLPVLILIVIALLISIWHLIKSRANRFSDYLQTHPGEFAMLLFILLYAGYSIQSPLNIGVRHLLPIIPLIYILTASGLKNWLKSNFFKTKAKVGFIALLIVWFTADVALSYPYYLSYFNQLIGTANGWQYVTDSNYDWGQDLKRLKTFVEANNIDKIGVDYFGGGNPGYYLGDKVEYWWSAKGDPKESGIKWLAVSVNTIQGSTKPWRDSNDPRKDEEKYLWLDEPYKPYAKAGTSIFIYKLD